MQTHHPIVSLCRRTHNRLRSEKAMRFFSTIVLLKVDPKCQKDRIHTQVEKINPSEIGPLHDSSTHVICDVNT